jgi:quercetin dioxygenase-like cupin family protein
MRRQLLAYNESVMIVRYHFVKGWKVQVTVHPHEQIVYAVTGRIQFDVNSETIELRRGQRRHAPWVHRY